MATDFISFLEGEDSILASGMPATCHLLLSTNSCSGSSPFSTSDTLAGGVGEITGTGYARTSQALPTPTAGALSFTISTWNTAGATDWPSTVRSVVLATTADNSGKAICAWNLVPGNGARDLSHAATVESATPTLTTESIDVSFASTVAQIATNTLQSSFVSAVGQILKTSAIDYDEGSNCVNNGTFYVYLVPSTGIYEVTVEIGVEVGATATEVAYGINVGSSSAGTAGFLGSFDPLVDISNAAGAYSVQGYTGYVSLNAGQYVNASVTAFGAGAPSLQLTDSYMSIQRIA